MEEGEFLGLVEFVSENLPGSLSFDSSLESFGWDSLGVIGLIAEVDLRFGISLDTDSLGDARTVGDLYQACMK